MGRSEKRGMDLEIAGLTPPLAPRRVRKCVQAKLPWAAERGNGYVALDSGLEAKETEERDGSGKGKGKKKARSQPRTPKMSPLKKGANGINQRGKKCESPHAYDASPQEKETDEEYNVRAPKKGNLKCCKALKFKGSKKCAVTPPKMSDSADIKYTEFQNKEKIQRDIFGLSQQNVPVVDLWSESKASAEENIRLSAGKETHPFFRSFKAVKKTLKASDALMWEIHQEEYVDGFLFCPIHVVDTLEDKIVPLDWNNWSFIDKPLFYDEAKPCVIAETYRTAGPLLFSNLCCKKHLYHLPDKTEPLIALSTSSRLSGGVTNERMMPNMVLDGCGNSSVPCFISLTSLDHGQACASVEERKLYYLRCSYGPKSSLWTNKYHPQSTHEVCGNENSVSFLKEWLKNWHRNPQNEKSSSYISSTIDDSDEDGIDESGSEMDGANDRAILKNVLLINGPIGSGKSAAVYACAKEQGFEVIEVNASDLRNGAHLKQKFSEGLESHGLSRWLSDRNDFCVSDSPDIIEIMDFENGCINNTFNVCKDESTTEISGNVTAGKSSSSQVERKSLILFEEVDIVFEEDRGFISSIIYLAEATKRPIVLTSNNKSGIVTKFVDWPILDFTAPSPSELLSHLNMVCNIEKIHLSSNLLERLISYCLGDIRKALMLLQFWCEGNGNQTDRNLECFCTPMQFDIDATHLILPHLIPWEFHCKISEKVEEEISKTLSLVELNFLFNNNIHQQQNSTHTPDDLNVRDDIDEKTQKRKRSLKRQRSNLESTEIASFVDSIEDRPIIEDRTEAKRRPCTVYSSQSDVEPVCNNSSSTDLIGNNDASFEDEVSLQPTMKTTEIMYQEGLHDLVYLSGEEIIRNPLSSHEEVPSSHVSFVPESLFVSGINTCRTECTSMPVYCDQVSVHLADSVSFVPVQLAGLDQLNELQNPIIASACDTEIESIMGSQEFDDTSNGLERSDPLEYNVMDQCSQAGFSRKSVRTDDENSPHSVQKTWRRLRSQRSEMKPYLDPNHREACSLVHLSYCLTDLLSETDIMISCCNPLYTDTLYPSLTRCIEPDTSSWYDQQLEMCSTYAEHGICLYAKKISQAGSSFNQKSTTNIVQEMVACANNTVTIGKLLKNQDVNNELLQSRSLSSDTLSSRRNLDRELYDAIASTVPARSSMTLKGPAFHDYVCFMSKISKLDRSHSSAHMDPTQRRRGRAMHHYLSSGERSLSPEYTELLSSCFSFKTEKEVHK